ncbi:MAG: bifunctional 2-polyprenyl-6-hydroxyphenol methylase/3-demethylubiquinol 3-O-methyltransferase UbiG [Alphaproteobacteria bacterium]
METPQATTTVDPAEVERFSALAATWWDPTGPMRPLHRLNPTRLRWIRDEICRNFARNATGPQPLAGLRVLDVGCGAGLVSEPLARMGAEVVGLDPSAQNIAAARLHADDAAVEIDYRSGTAEDLAAAGETFDVVLILEVVEHVTDVPRFVATTAGMVRPGGALIASTINRTPKAFLLAIVGAEYVLRWLPKGTHSYDRLVQPDELAAALRAGGMSIAGETGIIYSPLADEWRLARDRDVNYMMSARRPAAKAD